MRDSSGKHLHGHWAHGYAVRDKNGKYIYREYSRWKGIRKRTMNPNDSNYKDYGARGISLCESWAESFENFYRDMGPMPDESYTVERINNDGPYSPENCRWATRAEQVVNRRPISKARTKRTCIVCGDPHDSLGYCNMHYLRFRKNGSPFLNAMENPKGRRP